MTTGVRKTGDFCWINMLTPRPAEACTFFGALLGWTYAEMPGMGYRVLVDGHNIGGLFDLDGPNTPPGTPPVIGVMVKVASADAACDQVKALGGTAKPAFDIMDQGRMAVCTDPNGAEFDLWEPKQSHGMDADGAHHGAPSWFETMTTDVARASTFYTELFGWDAEVMSITGTEYTVFSLAKAPVAGTMRILPHMHNQRPHWSTYFTVDDADATARQAVTLGGTLAVPVQDIPGTGRFCGITSPQGVTFFVIRYAPRA